MNRKLYIGRTYKFWYKAIRIYIIINIQAIDIIPLRGIREEHISKRENYFLSKGMEIEEEETQEGREK